jgi:formate dehydrogenase subunit gamma
VTGYGTDGTVAEAQGYSGTYDKEAAMAVIASHAGMRGAMLPLLHAVQEAIGYVPDDLVPEIASALNISKADVHGVITFYHDFRRRPAGAHVVKICRAEACQARGGAAIEAAAAEQFGIALGSSSTDGRVTLEPIYCLGLCAVGPAALVDGVPVARVDAAKIARIVAKVAA